MTTAPDNGKFIAQRKRNKVWSTPHVITETSVDRNSQKTIDVGPDQHINVSPLNSAEGGS